MVFYYNDLALPEWMNDFLIVFIVLSTIILPLFIYYGKTNKNLYNIALIIAIILAILQFCAVVKNILKYPL